MGNHTSAPKDIWLEEKIRIRDDELTRYRVYKEDGRNITDCVHRRPGSSETFDCKEFEQRANEILKNSGLTGHFF